MATDPSGAGAVDPYAVPKAKVEDAAPAAEAGTAYFPGEPAEALAALVEAG